MWSVACAPSDQRSASHVRLSPCAQGQLVALARGQAKVKSFRGCISQCAHLPVRPQRVFAAAHGARPAPPSAFGGSLRLLVADEATKLRELVAAEWSREDKNKDWEAQVMAAEPYQGQVFVSTANVVAAVRRAGTALHPCDRGARVAGVRGRAAHA
jgi:hypothetical protein